MALPPAPPELVYALRVDVRGLRPWEYDGMDAELYDEIRALQAAYAEGVRQADALAEYDPHAVRTQMGGG